MYLIYRSVPEAFCHIIFFLAVCLLQVPSAHAEINNVVFQDNFELGWGMWYADNGIWEIGQPASGPGTAHSSPNCAAVVLDGNYPSYTDSRLISPTITLPSVPETEEIQLRFYQSASYSTNDYRSVQISQLDENSGNWSTWEDITPLYGGGSGGDVWSRSAVELTVFSGKTIRLSFYHTADSPGENNGWYIDDVQIVTGVPVFRNFEDFEYGWGDWSADNGLWEIGTPAAGPGNSKSGTSCAATVLDGNYPSYVDSRLISPTVTLPSISGAEEIHLRFYQSASYSTNDYHSVQISQYDTNSGNWSSWEDITPSYGGGGSGGGVWSSSDAELTRFAGKTVRVSFYHTADSPGENSGWYIDDVEIVTGVPSFISLEDFEHGWGGWAADNGLWEVGVPAAVPDKAKSGTSCAGVVLAGKYPSNTDSRLISPTITLSSVSGIGEIHLRFWQSASYSTNDYRSVQISQYDENSGQWSSWEDIIISEGGGTSGGVWSRYSVELTKFASKTVRIAFYHTADSIAENSGWYIDDIKIETVNPVFKIPESFEQGWGMWYADNGVWEVGPPSSGPGSAHSSPNCVATVLDDNYPTYTDSRLISPTIALPSVSGTEEIHLRFFQSASYSTNDYRMVQISQYDENSKLWSSWTDITPFYGGGDGGNVWSRSGVELTAFAGKNVRIAFYHTADSPGENSGWYLDDVEITPMPTNCYLDSDKDGYNSTACGGNDCDDSNASINPGMSEICDGLDNNCQNGIDEEPLASASCDNGLFCDGQESCQSGSCYSEEAPCDTQCQNCDETSDQCNDINGSCNDGLFCNGLDTCSGGSCSIHAGDPCVPDGDDCTDEICNESAGICQYTCNDTCENYPGKTEPGQCGCENEDSDSDRDGTADCNDGCVNDPGKVLPGICGCGIADTDSDRDGIADCNDGCVNDPGKSSPGVCGCNIGDFDSDKDGIADCRDNCPLHSNHDQKDSDHNGVGDICENNDQDGIADIIDGKVQNGIFINESHIFSNNFTDIHIGGVTHGRIKERWNLSMAIDDAESSSNGIQINAYGLEPGKALLNICDFDVEVSKGDALVATCSLVLNARINHDSASKSGEYFNIKAIYGLVKVYLSKNEYVEIPLGGEVQITTISKRKLIIANISNNKDISIITDDETYKLGPGKQIEVQPDIFLWNIFLPAILGMTLE